MRIRPQERFLNMAVYNKGLFAFFGKLIFSVREKLLRNFLRRLPGLPSPLPRAGRIPRLPEFRSRQEETVKEKGVKPKSQVEQYLASVEQEKAEVGQDLTSLPRVRLVEVFKADQPSSGPIIDTETGNEKGDFGELLLLYPRQSFVEDFKDSLLQLVPFWPQKKPERNYTVLKTALENYTKENPKFVETVEYRLIVESLTQAAERLPGIKEARAVDKFTYDKQKDSLPSNIEVARLIPDLSSNRVDLWQRSYRTILRVSPRISSFIQAGAKKTVVSLGKELFSRGAVGFRGLTGGLLRFGGRAALQVGVRAGVWLAGLTAGAIGVGSGFWIVLAAIIGGVVVLGLVFAVFSSSPFGAFSSQVGGAPQGSLGSQYISIEKEVLPSNVFKNEDMPKNVSYTIKVRSKKGELLGVEIKDVLTASNKDGTKTLQEKSWNQEKVTDEVKFEYSYFLDSGFSDSVVTNTVIVGAKVTDQPTRQTETFANSIRIGNPPDECPGGWPTDFGRVTQGPNGPFTHSGFEAIDIGNTDKKIFGQQVRATHSGNARLMPGMYPGYGQYVEVETTCQGKKVISLYAHLVTSAIGVGETKRVSKGDILGTIDATGIPPGQDDPNHLHYEFKHRSLRMAPPYIPREAVVGVGW